MYFGNQLLPFIPKLANSDGSKPFAAQTDIDDPLRSAIITCVRWQPTRWLAAPRSTP